MCNIINFLIISNYSGKIILFVKQRKSELYYSTRIKYTIIIIHYFDNNYMLKNKISKIVHTINM